MLIGKNPLKEQPDWFKKNIEIIPLSYSVEVDDKNIKYFIWGDQSLPKVFLLHGFNAHSYWWSHIAPFFTEKFCVIAMDFSGMGESDHREEYSQEIYSKEIKAVLEDTKCEKPICLAHSMGGAVAMYSTSIFPNLFSKIILLDSVVILPPERAEMMKSRRPKARMEIASDSMEAAVSRFRLMPPQPCQQEYVLEHIAKTSYKETELGWVLKSDPKISNTYKYNDLHETLMNPSTALEIIYGQLSQIFTSDVLEYMKYAGRLEDKNIHQLDGAMHHLFLDRPLEFKDLVLKILEN
tara:strand:- start:4 stop:885 length:882 start_codon:yes stop_codon:yes gene_type:complete